MPWSSSTCSSTSPSDAGDLNHIEHQQLIDELFDYDDPVASEGRFRAAAFDPSATDSDRDVLITQLARAIGLQDRFDEATLTLDGVRDSTDREVRVRLDLEQGRIANSGGHPELARPHFESAVSEAQAAGYEHLAVDAMHMLAMVAAAAEQDKLNGRALEIASAARDPRARQWRASLLNNMGWTAFDRGDYAAALALFDDALAARLEHGKVADIQVARWCVARTLRQLGRVDEALTIQRALAEEHAAAGTTDSYVDEEIEALTQTSATPAPEPGSA